MVKLAVTEFGDGGSDVPLVLLHGLLGTARNLALVARGFVGSRRVIGLDMRNHGASPWTQTHNYPDLAEDVSETLWDLGVLDFDLLGHSMGGKAAMYGVLTGVLRPRRLVIGDIAPVEYAHTQAHVIDAMMSVDLTEFDRRGALAKRLGDLLDDAGLGPFLAQAATFGERPAWRHNLSVLLKNMPEIIGFPDISRVYDGPTLIVSGGQSDYVEVDAVLRVFPHAQLETIPEAGHWVHADAPAAFNALVAKFLSS